MKKFLLLLALSVITTLAGSAKTLMATQGKLGSNAKYDATTGTFSWTNSIDNNMPIFTFTDGELANYEKLVFTNSDLTTEGTVSDANKVYRVLFVGSSSTLYTLYYAASGTVSQELSLLGIDLASVKEIRFGGSCTAGSFTVSLDDVYLATADEDEKASINGSKYSLDLNDNSLHVASWDSSTKTFRWESNGLTNNGNSYYIRFNVSKDVAASKMTNVAITFSSMSNTVRIYLVDEEGTWYNINDFSNTTTETEKGDIGDTFKSTSTKSIDISNLGHQITSIIVKAAQGNGTGNIYTIDSIVFSKPLKLEFNEDGDALLYPVDFEGSGCVSIDSEGNITIDTNATSTKGELTATLSESCVFDSDVQTMTVYVDDYTYRNNSNGDYYKYIRYENNATSGGLYSSRYDSTDSTKFANKTVGAVKLGFEVNTNTVGTFSKLYFVRFSKFFRTSGVEDVVVSEDFTAPEAEAVYYNLQGAKVSNPEHGIFIRCQGGKTQKVVL